jgi:hypothetical protein
MQNYYYPTSPYYPVYRQVPEHLDSDQRFFPFLLPFVAGLAISPFLFNRPFYQPYPAPYPVPSPYPLPVPTPYPSSPGYGGYPSFPQPYAAQVPIPAAYP